MLYIDNDNVDDILSAMDQIESGITIDNIQISSTTHTLFILVNNYDLIDTILKKYEIKKNRKEIIKYVEYQNGFKKEYGIFPHVWKIQSHIDELYKNTMFSGVIVDPCKYLRDPKPKLLYMPYVNMWKDKTHIKEFMSYHYGFGIYQDIAYYYGLGKINEYYIYRDFPFICWNDVQPRKRVDIDIKKINTAQPTKTPSCYLSCIPIFDICYVVDVYYYDGKFIDKPFHLLISPIVMSSMSDFQFVFEEETNTQVNIYMTVAPITIDTVLDSMDISTKYREILRKCYYTPADVITDGYIFNGEFMLVNKKVSHNYI